MRINLFPFLVLSLLFAPAVALPLRSDAAEADAAEKKRELTPEELAEKQSRRACKVEICSVLASKDASGPDIACDIVKTWRKEDIVDMLGGRIDWPYGKAVCSSKLRLKRELLASAMSQPSYEVALDEQTVRCELAQKQQGEPYVVQVTMSPTVAFKDGKATEAQLNWGNAEAPLGIYPMIYAGTGLDNSTNVLGPEVVRLVNEFTGKKCAEVMKQQRAAR